MGEPASEQAVAAATAYEEFFVPAMFAHWAPRVADAAQVRHGQRLLDVACGTGVLAREAARRVGNRGKVVGLDSNPGMLAVAARVAPLLEWQCGDAQALPFPDGSFDVVASQFGLMFFGDRVRALREMLRVLVPGGRLVACVWDAIDNIPAYALELDLLARLAGDAAAAALQAPFALGERKQVEQLFEDAGAEGVTAVTLTGAARFPSIREMIEADVRGWLPLAGVVLTEAQSHAIVEQSEQVFQPYVDERGRVEIATSAHIVCGVRR
jgi:ubiquinone/menaquinone biosynthesis C-methylase UbiE